jgi:hypothetical protein
VDLLNAQTESPHAVEDLVSGLHPFERRAPVVGVAYARIAARSCAMLV